MGAKNQATQYDSFNTAANSLNYHLETILNFFKNRHTNANAESFNSKIKLFRANQRGVVDVKFFLFRMEKLLLNPHKIYVTLLKATDYIDFDEFLTLY